MPEAAFLPTALALAALGVACDEQPPAPGERSEPLASVAARGERSTPRATPARPTRPPTPPLVEGAPSAEEVMARFERALAAGDAAELLGCIHPETRRAWLGDLLVELAVDSTDARLAVPLEERRRKEELRALLRAHGALIAERPTSLDQRSLARGLLAGVRDPDGLHVALLDFARRSGAELDPVRALAPKARVPLGGPRPSASAEPLTRLAKRVRGARIAKGRTGAASGEGGAAFAHLVEVESTLQALRFRRDAERVWLDES